MIARLALRNLTRNRWRTVLTVGGIAVATGLVIWIGGLMDAFMGRMVDSAIGTELGHVQIHSHDYIEDRNIYNAFGDLDAVTLRAKSVDGVDGVAPRIHGFGLIGHESRSQVARIIGVDPTREGRVSNAPSSVSEGRWLAQPVKNPDPDAPLAPREAVIGTGLAERLSVTVGDALVVITQGADGSSGNDLLTIVGLVRTGSTIIDRMGVYIPLEEAQFLSALDGMAHELAISVSGDQSPKRLKFIAEALTKAMAAAPALALGPAAPDSIKGMGLQARPWTEIVPELHQMVEMSRGQSGIMFFIIFAIAALGILNTQRMSAMERRREFAVMLAIGQSPGGMGRMVLLEAVLVSLGGGLLGAVLGGIGMAYHATVGFAMTSGDGGEMTYMGMDFSRPILFEPNLGHFLGPIIAIALVGLLCGLWPAIKSARLDIVRAIAGRT